MTLTAIKDDDYNYYLHYDLLKFYNYYTHLPNFLY